MTTGGAHEQLSPQEIVSAGLDLLGPDRGSIVVEHTYRGNLRWANSTLTSNGWSRERVVHVIAHPRVGAQAGMGNDGGSSLASGAASGTVRTRGDLASLVARARAGAIASGPAADAADEITRSPAASDWDQPPADLSPADLAPAAGVLAEAIPDATTEWFGYAEQSLTTTWAATTSGARLRFDQPAARFELSGKNGGRTRSAWAGRSGRMLADLSLTDTIPEVRLGLSRQRRRIDHPPGPTRVLLSPSAVADLLLDLVWSAGALDAIEGRSAFSTADGGTRLGERISDAGVRIWSDPLLSGLECAPFVTDLVASAMSSPFDLGLPIGPADWVREGILTSLVTTRHSAGLASIAHTPAVDNLAAGVHGRTGTIDDVAQRMGDGLLVTCLWYIRMLDAPTLLVTGLTRDGVYVVRGGEVIGAAGNFRFNESPLAMLSRIVDAGDPVAALPREWADYFTRTRMAPLAIDGFHLSTASEAI